MNISVINFGSINIDHVYQVPTFVQPGETLASLSLATGLGGKGANQSVALARAGAGVAHIGRLSKMDTWAIDILAESGVDTAPIELIDDASGHAIIQIDAQAENAIILHGGANQSFTVSAVAKAIDRYPEAEYLLMQNECNLLDEAFALALKKGLKVVLNPAPMADNILSLPLDKLDTLIVNEIEAQGLSGKNSLAEMVEALNAMVPNTRVVITLGADGALLLEDGVTTQIEAEPVKAVDTTGAGDTFVGYFLAGMIEKLPAEQALCQACKAAAVTVTRAGAIASIPTLAELN